MKSKWWRSAPPAGVLKSMDGFKQLCLSPGSLCARTTSKHTREPTGAESEPPTMKTISWSDPPRLSPSQGPSQPIGSKLTSTQTLTLPYFTHGPPDGLTSYTAHLCALNLTERPPMVLPASVTKPSICPALYSPLPLFPSVSISNSPLLSGVSLSPSLSLSRFCFSFLFFSLYLPPLLLHIHTFSLSLRHTHTHTPWHANWAPRRVCLLHTGRSEESWW